MEQQIIVSNPKIMMRQPVVSRTRITLDCNIEKLSEGETLNSYCKVSSALDKEGIQAALNLTTRSLT